MDFEKSGLFSIEKLLLKNPEYREDFINAPPYLSYSHFLASVIQNDVLYSFQNLQIVFKMLDTGRENVLTNNSISTALKKFGFDISPAEVHIMVLKEMPNYSGQMDFEQFRKIFEEA